MFLVLQLVELLLIQVGLNIFLNFDSFLFFFHLFFIYFLESISFLDSFVFSSSFLAEQILEGFLVHDLAVIAD